MAVDLHRRLHSRTIVSRVVFQVVFQGLFQVLFLDFVSGPWLGFVSGPWPRVPKRPPKRPRGQSCEDVSGGSGQTTCSGHLASQSGEGLRRKWPDHLGAMHLRAQSSEDVSGGSGLNTSPQGLSQPRVARMSQAKVPGPPWGSAPPRSEFGGGLTRKWPEHLNPGHIRDQVSMMSQAAVA